MHVLACNAPPHPREFLFPGRFGRRQIVVDGASSVFPQRSVVLDSDVSEASSESESVGRSSDSQTFEVSEMMSTFIPFMTRRKLFASSAFGFCLHPSRYFSALALGDPSVNIEDLTPQILPFGPLFPSEQRTAELFEKNTYSVVNIFDVTLWPQLNVTGVVEVPEGNGSGVIWDNTGYILTNYHVVGNALSRNPNPGQVIACVNILALEGVQNNFEGKLIGADRAKDLAVLNGGPLLDSKEYMAGINTAIFTLTGTSAGVGFSIPSSTVLKIVPQLIQFGRVVRAGLNVEIAPDLIANQLNVQNGALVLQVPGNSFAAKAGLLPTSRRFAGNIVLGDVIIAVNDKPTRSKSDLLKVLDDYSIGDKVMLKIQRGAQSLDLPLIFGRD